MSKDEYAVFKLSKADDPFDQLIGIVLGILALAAIFYLAAFGIVIGFVCVGLWLIYKQWRFSPATIARREIEAISELRQSVAYLAGRVTIPDPVRLAETIITTVDNDLPDGRCVPAILIDPIFDVTAEVLAQSGLAPLPTLDMTVLRQDVDARNKAREKLYALQAIYQSGEASVDAVYFYLCNCIGNICEALPANGHIGDEPNDYDFTIELLDLIENPKQLAEILINLPFAWDEATVKPFQDASVARMAAISGKRVDDLLANPQRMPNPTDAKGEGRDVFHQYLSGSPFMGLLQGRVAYRLPVEARFEHMHIVAGTGHGKTQLIQRLVREDLHEMYFYQRHAEVGVKPADQKTPLRSLIVIDGQGEMIDAIARRRFCDPNGALRDKVILIDPTDTEFPLALNMFDIGQDNLATLPPVEREMIFNGTVELYVYLFGALLSAELTQKQDVLFRYVARLMLAIPNATLDTLRDVIENGETYQPQIDALDHSSQEFFRTQFFGKEFQDTKRQVLRRLWGVLSNHTLAAMFNSPVNKIDLFAEMQAGKVILINTAKDFLKTDGARIFGRFWIAMIAQAALRRAAIEKSARVDTHVYIDEAHEYIDDKVEEILNQARKYRIGLHCAHQTLSQLSPTQRATFASSAAIKMVGGASDADARAYAGDMRTDPDSIKGTRKRSGGAEFMTYVRNHTERAVKLNVGFGTLERMDTLDDWQFEELRDRVRERYSTPIHKNEPESGGPNEASEADEVFQLGEHEVV